MGTRPAQARESAAYFGNRLHASPVDIIAPIFTLPANSPGNSSISVHRRRNIWTNFEQTSAPAARLPWVITNRYSTVTATGLHPGSETGPRLSCLSGARGGRSCLIAKPKKLADQRRGAAPSPGSSNTLRPRSENHARPITAARPEFRRHWPARCFVRLAGAGAPR